MYAIKQLFRFGWEQALSCVFPVVIFGALALTSVVHFPWLPRYDWLLLICIVMQIVMVVSGLETLDELKVITLFHIIGIALEIFKVHMGSWTYPNPGYATVFHVPLFSGFMYASVASYIVQAWRRLDVTLIKWPPFALATGLAVAIYLNFFTHHFWYDLRWLLFVLVILLFWNTKVTYKVGEKQYRMPLVLSFALIGFFIWLAENIATFFHAWEYPNQERTWNMVELGKISSWLLLIIVSFLIVASLKQVKGEMHRL
jgi:uncharacterized membrane protein YoaT (DUF817 family)